MSYAAFWFIMLSRYFNNYIRGRVDGHEGFEEIKFSFVWRMIRKLFCRIDSCMFRFL